MEEGWFLSCLLFFLSWVSWVGSARRCEEDVDEAVAAPSYDDGDGGDGGGGDAAFYGGVMFFDAIPLAAPHRYSSLRIWIVSEFILVYRETE